MKRIATLDAVFDACRALEQKKVKDGTNWDRDDVRSVIGGGSYSVIEPLIKTWRDHAQLNDELPSMRATLMLELSKWLDSQFDTQFSALTGELCSNFDLLAADNTQLSNENQQLQQQLQELQEALQASNLRNQQLERENTSLQEEIESLEGDVDEKADLLEAMQETNSQVQAQQQQALEQIEKMFASANDVWKEEKSALLRNLGELERQLVAQSDQIQKLTANAQRTKLELDDATKAHEQAINANQLALQQLELEHLKQLNELNQSKQLSAAKLEAANAALEKAESERTTLLTQLLSLSKVEANND